jgi:hypothetical protein
MECNFNPENVAIMAGNLVIGLLMAGVQFGLASWTAALKAFGAGLAGMIGFILLSRSQVSLDIIPAYCSFRQLWQFSLS